MSIVKRLTDLQHLECIDDAGLRTIGDAAQYIETLQHKVDQRNDQFEQLARDILLQMLARPGVVFDPRTLAADAVIITEAFYEKLDIALTTL